MPNDPSILYYATEARLHRGPDGTVYSDSSQEWYESHSLWLRSFDEVRIVARVESGTRDSGKAVEGPGVSVVAVPSYRGARGAATRFLSVRKAIRQACVDSAAVYGGRFPGVIGALTLRAGKRIGARTFAHVVGDPYDLLKSGVAGRLGSALAWCARLFMATQIARVDGAIYVSERTLQARYPLRPGSASLAWNSTSLTAEAFAAAAKVPDPRRDFTTVVAVGTHKQMYKGHDLLLEAVARLNSQGKRIRLWLIGGGDMHETLVELAQRLGIEQQVRFFGHLESPVKVREIVDRADLFAMPSRTEGVPRALAEAMALGLPCIGSNVGGIPELLPSECLVTPGSVTELTRLLEKRISDDEWLKRQAIDNLARARALGRSLDPGRVDDFFARLTSVTAVGTK